MALWEDEGGVLGRSCNSGVAAWVPLSHCSKKPVGVARKEDIPYIRCQVCEKLAKELHQQVHHKQAQIAPKKVLVV